MWTVLLFASQSIAQTELNFFTYLAGRWEVDIRTKVSGLNDVLETRTMNFTFNENKLLVGRTTNEAGDELEWILKPDNDLATSGRFAIANQHSAVGTLKFDLIKSRSKAAPLSHVSDEECVWGDASHRCSIVLQSRATFTIIIVVTSSDICVDVPQVGRPARGAGVLAEEWNAVSTVLKTFKKRQRFSLSQRHYFNKQTNVHHTPAQHTCSSFSKNS